MVRLANLDDRFDGMDAAKSYKFDINAWAREFYLEANSHLLSKNSTSELLRGIRLNITEMNLAGSIPKSFFNGSVYAQENWVVRQDAPQGAQNESANSTSEDSKEEQSKKDQQPKSEKSEKKQSLVEEEPKDNLQFVEVERARGSAEGLGTLFEYNYIVTMEPQSIRTFSIQYFMPNLEA